MASAPRAVFGPGLTGLYDWATADWTHAALAGGAALASAGAVLLLVAAVRRRRAEAAARRKAAIAAGQEPDEGLDVFTAYVTVMATLLSINGVWHVFTVAVPLPWFARLVACTVMESSGLAFMRQARRDIKRGTPATRHVVTVWTIACLSGGLSAAASSSVLEGVIRVALPLLAVHLCHAWMLPLTSEVTLSQHEKGKRAWRYVKANRRRDRAGNLVTIYLAQKLLNLESDRLTKRALMTGDATSVLAASERIAITEALSGLGLDTAGAGSESTELAWTLGPVESDPWNTPAPAGLAWTLGPVADADPRTRESGSAGLADSDPAVIARTLGPESVDSEQSADLGPRDADPESTVLPAESEEPADVPVLPVAEPSIVPVARPLVPEQRTNGLMDGGALPEWLQQRTPLGGPVADPPGSESEIPADSQIEGSTDPAGSESEIDGPATGPQAVPGSESESEIPVDPEQESEGPTLPVPESEPPVDPESETYFAALPWSVETSRTGRKIVAEWRAGGRQFTRGELLAAVREGGGTVSSRDRAGFWSFAIAPELPTAADNADDAFDLVGAGADAR